VLAEQQDRDARDAVGGDRTVDAPAPGAVELDTTGLTIDEVVQRIVGPQMIIAQHREAPPKVKSS
jgi:cytidylate kinase